MAYTIAIAGTSGAGKTSVARAVAEALDSPVLHFDDYEYPDPASVYPDFEGWIARGLPVAWHGAATLAGEVAKLRAGDDIRDPKTERVISPGPFLVIEEPFGRARPVMAPLIDLAVVVGTPSDVALARRLARELSAGSDGAAANLQAYLAWYLAGGRAFYDRLVGLAKVGADLIVDGELPVSDVTQLVVGRASASKASR